MSFSANMDHVQAFLTSLALDEETLSYLCVALDDCDLDSSELQDFLEPFLSAEAMCSLLKMAPTSSQRNVGAASLALRSRQLQDLSLLNELQELVTCDEAAADTVVKLGHNVAECALAVRGATQTTVSQLTKEDALNAETDVDSDERDLSPVHTYFQEAGSIKKGDHVMIKDLPCKVKEIFTSKIWKGPYRGCFQSKIIAHDIFTGKKFEHTCPASQHVNMPFVKRDEYTVIDIGREGELSLLTPMCDMKVDLNLPTETEDDHKIAEAIKTDFNNGRTVVVVVQSACGVEKLINYRSLD